MHHRHSHYIEDYFSLSSPVLMFFSLFLLSFPLKSFTVLSLIYTDNVPSVTATSFFFTFILFYSFSLSHVLFTLSLSPPLSTVFGHNLCHSPSFIHSFLLHSPLYLTILSPSPPSFPFLNYLSFSSHLLHSSLLLLSSPEQDPILPHLN